MRTLSGISRPHAILYRDDLSRIYVTDGGDGDLKIFDGKTYSLLKSVYGIGTAMRVQCEEELLRSPFGSMFDAYQSILPVRHRSSHPHAV